MRRRVVITGMGAVTPAGNDVLTMWESVVAGRSGVGRITRFDPAPFKTQIAAEIKDFDPTRYMDRKDARRLDWVIALAVNAAGEAIADADIKAGDDGIDGDRVGVVIGSGIGGIGTVLEHQGVLEKSGPSRISPFFVPAVLVDMPAGYVAIQYGFRGPNMAIVTACATGANAVGESMHMIRRGDVDIVVAGGVESAVLPLTIAGFDQMGALACGSNHEPTRACRPFDRDRGGFVMGEGAGILVLEELEHARRRGARIYGELAGYGTSADAYHIAAPDPEGVGAKNSMRHALRDAGMAPEEIGYINAHGTGTPLNDPIEILAIRSVFGPAAEKVLVSSTKPVTGHLLGAAGAVELMIATLALRNGWAPPTINLENPDPSCDLDCVPLVAREVQCEAAMSNAFGFGGHNASVIVRRYEETL